MRTNTRLYLSALLLFLAGTGYLLYTAVNANKSYHVDVAEALTMSLDDLRSVRIFGIVSPEGISRPPDASGVRFILRDLKHPDKTLPVVYRGAIPDGFKAEAELYATGSCAGTDRTLTAHELTTKCPSKYKKENRS